MGDVEAEMLRRKGRKGGRKRKGRRWKRKGRRRMRKGRRRKRNRSPSDTRCPALHGCKSE